MNGGNPEFDRRFDLLLREALHEEANPAPAEEFSGRLYQALNELHDTRLRKEEPMMSTSTTLPSSILWTGQQPASGWNLRGLFGAALAHALVFALLVFLVAHRVPLVRTVEPVVLVQMEAPPLPAKAAPRTLAMGGGGGQKGPTPVTRGTPPRFAPQTLNPPKAPALEQPKLEVPVTVNVKSDLKMAPSEIPQIGVQNSPLVGMSMGNGQGTGLGSGRGDGIGPGSGGNMGGGVERIGGSVAAPVVLFQPEPEFSEEARKAKASGNVIVALQVDEMGRPQHVHVVRGIGLGLDEKAVEAVRRYRFRPATKDGHPVTVEMNVDVGFQIF